MGDAAYALERHDIRDEARAQLMLLRGTPVFRESVRRQLIAGLHEKQLEVLRMIEAGERYISLCCGRRAGKTHLLATLIVLFLLDLEFGQEVVFVAPTLKRGKELIWDEVERIHETYLLGWKLTANQGTIRTPTGGRFRIVGLDNKKQIGKIARGGNTRAFLTDESQEFAHLLQQFLDAASPALGQTRGLFIASGTPGYVKRGYWYRVCRGEEGFTNVSWTLFDNPFLGRDADEIVEEEIARKKWPRNHPTLRREWFAEWLDDVTRKVFELSDANKLDAIEGYDARTWRHVIGVDYGNAPDPCAWVVLAADPYTNFVAVVHAETHHRLTSDQICAKTNELRLRFRAERIVGDSASGGKTFIQDFNERHARAAGFYMQAADKADRKDSIDLVNTELRSQRLVVLKSGAGVLIDEMDELQWDEDHKEFLPGPDHAADAARYGIRALRAFITKPAANGPKSAEERELERIIARNNRAKRAAGGGFFG